MYNDCEAFFLRELINEYQNLRQGRYFHNIFSLVDSKCISEIIVMYHVFFYVFLLQKPNLYYDHCFIFQGSSTIFRLHRILFQTNPAPSGSKCFKNN